ncbi:MAG: hypothetical protein DHS20C14_20510 [Phycisphaeraceae bacterium]|nr:MAG: hypothetical protein DHS20C14_20510 [Phycisphaeraceae bacterium]
MNLDRLPSPICSFYCTWREIGESIVIERIAHESGLGEEDCITVESITSVHQVVLKVRLDQVSAVEVEDRLRKASIQYHTRWRRDFGTELKAEAAWLWITTSSTNVLLDTQRQEWFHDTDCAECGAGGSPAEPLRLKTVRMPASGFAQECRTGQLVVRAELADRLISAGLTGLDRKLIQRRRESKTDLSLVWLDVAHVWPRFSSHEGWSASEVCNKCFRSGYYNSNDAPFSLIYDSMPEYAPDFGRTAEGWGAYRECHGAAPHLIVSQRAYRVLRDCGVGLSMEPVFFREQ